MEEIDEEEYLEVLNKLTEKYINSLKSGTDFEKSNELLDTC